jgi:hypothetical protein
MIVGKRGFRVRCDQCWSHGRHAGRRLPQLLYPTVPVHPITLLHPVLQMRRHSRKTPHALRTGPSPFLLNCNPSLLLYRRRRPRGSVHHCNVRDRFYQLFFSYQAYALLQPDNPGVKVVRDDDVRYGRVLTGDSRVFHFNGISS